VEKHRSGRERRGQGLKKGCCGDWGMARAMWEKKERRKKSSEGCIVCVSLGL